MRSCSDTDIVPGVFHENFAPFIFSLFLGALYLQFLFDLRVVKARKKQFFFSSSRL